MSSDRDDPSAPVDEDHNTPDPEWPLHFPSSCPPSDANDLNGAVYMLVATDPPTAKDMECAIDRKTFRNKPECLRASLSCTFDPDHLSELRDNVPRLAAHMIASGNLEPKHGKIMQTGAPLHQSMWLRAKYLTVGHTMFKVRP